MEDGGFNHSLQISQPIYLQTKGKHLLEKRLSFYMEIGKLQ